MIVLDASAAVALLLGGGAAERVHARLREAEGELFAPHLIDVEVAQVLRKLARGRQLTAERAGMAIEDLADLPVRREPHDVLLPRIWALRANATAYDAAYLALAEGLDATLLTCDARLASVPGFRRRVEVV